MEDWQLMENMEAPGEKPAPVPLLRHTFYIDYSGFEPGPVLWDAGDYYFCWKAGFHFVFQEQNKKRRDEKEQMRRNRWR